MQDDWAIVIGINRYPKITTASSLQGAVYDAERFIEWLVSPSGGAVPEVHIGRFLQDPNPEAPLGPTEVQLRSFIEQTVLNLLPNRPIGRRLYLYFSGHGISPTGQESIRNAALLMANAVHPHPLFHVPGNLWAEGMRSSAYFREVVLIMDCCRDLEKNVIPNSDGMFDPVDISKGLLLVEAYATTWHSKSREMPIPPPNGKVQGVFTHAVLQVLNSGRVSGTLFKQSVQRYLARLLQDEKKAQEPVIRPDEELAKITFSEAAPLPRTPVTIKGHPNTPPVIEFFPPGSDTTQQVALDGWTFQDGAWLGELEPTTYMLQLPGGGSKRFNIYAAVPEEVQV